MGKKGVTCFKKANAFALHKWNTKEGVRKKTGTIKDDMIEYVCQKMYKFLVGSDKDMYDEADDVLPDTNNVSKDDTVDDSTSQSTPDKNICENNTAHADIPNDYIFPSFIAFILWGPFADQGEQLGLFTTGNCYALLCIENLVLHI